MAPIRLLLAAVAVAALAVACSDDDSTAEGRQDPAAAAAADLDAQAAAPRDDVDVDGPSTNSPTTTPSTTTTTIPGIVVNKFALTIDDCFDQLEDLAAGRPREVTTKIPCDEPHDAQIFSRLSYPAEPGELYPGDDIVEDYALAACYLRFEAWADAIYETSALEIRAFTPTRDDFEAQSYRGIQCFVEREDGDKLVGTSRSSGL
ncbi:MAG: hypothetical protein VW060_06175 [Acidimicrobiaceae bacterium]|jgi:hypothetical protein|nr:hypothetical protein [Acidimicrobiales bacterium]